MIPHQVEEAANLAEELHGKMNPDAEAQEEEQEEEAGEPETSESDSGDKDKETELEVTDQDVEEEEEPDYKALYEKSEQSRKTLQGKYDAEVPRLHGDLKELKERVFERIGEVSEQVKKVSPEEETAPEVDEVIEEYREEYGDDFIKLATHIAKKEINSSLPDAIKPVEDKVSGMEETQANAEKEAFETELSNAVDGDWNAALNDEGFKEFLSQEDPSGFFTYGEAFANANNNWDAPRLAKIFNAYLGKGQAKEEPAPGKKADPAEEALIAPNKKGGHGQPKTVEGRIWTEEDIENFKRDDRMNKYTAEQSIEMWEDLLAAINEDRIR